MSREIKKYTAFICGTKDKQWAGMKDDENGKWIGSEHAGTIEAQAKEIEALKAKCFRASTLLAELPDKDKEIKQLKEVVYELYCGRHVREISSMIEKSYKRVFE